MSDHHNVAAASELLRQRHGIVHITLQPEIRDPGSGRTSVVRFLPRGRHPRG